MGLTDHATFVEVGCPSPPNKNEYGLTPVVDAPSPYLLFLFIVPDDEIPAIVQQNGSRVRGQERICDGDVCWEVTRALFVGESSARDLVSVVEILREALSFNDAR
jgi:hypothetical protein